MMSYEKFVAFILEQFGENAKVKNDRENGLYLAKAGEFRISLAHSGKRVRIYNVRSHENFMQAIA
jgi:hypothetical protein